MISTYQDKDQALLNHKERGDNVDIFDFWTDNDYDTMDIMLKIFLGFW